MPKIDSNDLGKNWLVILSLEFPSCFNGKGSDEHRKCGRNKYVKEKRQRIVYR